ncbi:uncharacterized protein [Haliotis cracherodii]|uniref:uncharacterized protein n=1 Tax=Haliotis cracherodii TaxID=6455 RepID=UPI0039E9A504
MMLNEVITIMSWIVYREFAEGYIVGSTGKQARASTFYPDKRPEMAVDGNTNAVWPNLFHAFENDSSPWWQVDLAEEVFSPEVTVYFRSDYTLRRNGVKISLSPSNSTSAAVCHTVTGQADGSDIPTVYTIRCYDRGRYLTLSTHTDNGDGIVLDFGEVEVHGCSAMTYGSGCNIDCHCNGTTCGPVTGACPSGCQAGWTTESCGQLEKAKDVSVYTKNISSCPIKTTFHKTTVAMATLREMEVVRLLSRIDCMHACYALTLCTHFGYDFGNCSLWRLGSAVGVDVEIRELLKKEN